jgi:hypothetical protein
MKNLVIAILVLALGVQTFVLLRPSSSDPQPATAVSPEHSPGDTQVADDLSDSETERLRNRVRELEAELARTRGAGDAEPNDAEIGSNIRGAFVPMRTVTDLAERGVLSVGLSLMDDDGRLSEEAIELYELGPAEVEAVNRALEHTWSELGRMTEEHTTVSYNDDGALIVSTEPFTDAGTGIHDELVGELESILGEERSRSLFRLAGWGFEGDFDNFGAMRRTLTISRGRTSDNRDYFNVVRREETGESTSTHTRMYWADDDGVSIPDDYPNLRNILREELAAEIGSD